MPDSITDLLKLEMNLALRPEQDNFDRNFKQLFNCKSYDMFYVYQKIHGSSCEAIDSDKLTRLAMIDYIHDFSADRIAADTDLNLYTYIRKNNLSPRQVLDRNRAAHTPHFSAGLSGMYLN